MRDNKKDLLEEMIDRFAEGAKHAAEKGLKPPFWASCWISPAKAAMSAGMGSGMRTPGRDGGGCARGSTGGSVNGLFRVG